MFKLFVLVACLVIVASTDDYDEYEHEDFYSHPTHKYGVKNPHTGEHKSQWEVRDEDAVKGAYTIQEADGTERVVEYKSDNHNGFETSIKIVAHFLRQQVFRGDSSHGYPEFGHGSGVNYNNVNKYYSDVTNNKWNKKI